MLRLPILEQDDVLAPPVGPDHRQEPLMSFFGPFLRDDGLLEHQEHGASATPQAAFEPPFDCRRVSGRRVSW